jgi:hemolysin III
MNQTEKLKINWNPSDEEIKERKEEYKSLELVYYTPLEELLNAITHGEGIFLGIIALIFTLSKATTASGVVLGILICLGFIILYATSATYHAIKNTDLKRKIRKFDHASVILVVISCGAAVVMATPPSTVNYIILGLCYGLAAVNYIGCIVNFKTFRIVALINDFVAGAFLVIAYLVSKDFIPFDAKMWYLAGVIFCLIGAIFYKIGKKYTHTVFHVLTFVGPACCIAATYIML